MRKHGTNISVYLKGKECQTFSGGKEQSIKLLLLLPQSDALFSLEQHCLLNLLCSRKGVDYGVIHVPHKMTENNKHFCKESGKYIFVFRFVF